MAMNLTDLIGRVLAQVEDQAKDTRDRARPMLQEALRAECRLVSRTPEDVSGQLKPTADERIKTGHFTQFKPALSDRCHHTAESQVLCLGNPPCFTGALYSLFYTVQRKECAVNRCVLAADHAAVSVAPEEEPMSGDVRVGPRQHGEISKRR